MKIETIQKFVCQEFDLPIDSLNKKTRKRIVVLPRQVSHYFLNKQLNLKPDHIAFMTGWDRCTIMFSIKTVKNLIETDKEFREIVDRIGQRLTYLETREKYMEFMQKLNINSYNDRKQIFAI